MADTIIIHPSDNVGVVIKESVAKGTIHENVVLLDDIKSGHKFALRDIAEGEDIIKYGHPIGHASRDVKKGEWVHTHNLRTSLSDNLQYTYSGGIASDDDNVGPDKIPTFRGYLRRNGDVGIRNELWIIPTVGCVNGVADLIAEKVRRECDITNVTDIRVWRHNYGCSQLGQDHESTKKILADLVSHPNAGGVLVLGLGCENNQIKGIQEIAGEVDPDRVKWLVAQEVDDEVACGFELCRDLIEKMRGDERVELPVSKLRIGLKCGGSDGLSGITANPLVGRISDFLSTVGGTAVLTEVPEMFGAETLLMSRCRSEEIFDKTVSLINDFKDYYRRSGQPIYENPSPGNKAGGITTLEEKSLGCVQKGGSAVVEDVVGYGERVSKAGLNLLSAPGNDLVASTALAASGCHMVLFTTGRGTPFGTVVPTIKISTNTPLADKKVNWIDFNAGRIIEGKTFAEMQDELLALIIETASGKETHNEKAGAKEMAIFKTGVTL